MTTQPTPLLKITTKTGDAYIRADSIVFLGSVVGGSVIICTHCPPLETSVPADVLAKEIGFKAVESPSSPKLVKG